MSCYVLKIHFREPLPDVFRKAREESDVVVDWMTGPLDLVEARYLQRSAEAIISRQHDTKARVLLIEGCTTPLDLATQLLTEFTQLLGST